MNEERFPTYPIGLKTPAFSPPKTPAGEREG
jgi:hypothetical protein